MSKPPSVTNHLRLLKYAAGAEAGGHFGMHPSAPPSPESMNRMNLDEDKTGEELSADEMAIVFSFLPHQDIMRARRVCTTWRDAAKKTLVPPSVFVVDNVDKYNTMRIMTTALPNLQQISIRGLGWGHNKYVNGEDPDERRALETANWNAHDIDIISNFRKLSGLHIHNTILIGRYPVLFNFPLLQILSIYGCSYLKWDLGMLERLPLIKELQLIDNQHLTGSLSDLRALKDDLKKVHISGSASIEGNFMELADFPRLKKLYLRETSVTGDIRNIRRNDFPALENLALPKSVVGGTKHEFQSISEVPSVMHTIQLLLQRTPTLFESKSKFKQPWLSRAFDWKLSKNSPDWYNGLRGSPQPPFCLQIIQAGSRLGWSWCVRTSRAQEARSLCQINWLDPEPSSDNSDYAAYIAELEHIERRIGFYRGYHEPPTEEEYRRLCGVPARIPEMLWP